MKYPKVILLSLIVVLFAVAGSFAQEPMPNPAAAPTSKIMEGGVLNGKAVSLPKPYYPDEARKAKVGGAVTVEVTIDEGGNVIEAKAVTKTAEPTIEPQTPLTAEQMETGRLRELLAAAAEDAARQAVFSPTTLSGVPVKVTGRIVYNFLPSNDDQKTKAINGGVLNGKAISLPHPPYPPAAAAVRASGTVTVQILVDESGNVVSASAISGHPLLREAAVSAARQAKFSPTLLNGEPVKISGVLTYVFSLPKKEPGQ
jgi:TonB family protein